MDLHVQGIHLPNSLNVPTETHKKAHKATRTGKKRKQNPFLLPALFIVVVSLPAAAVFACFILILTLPKLDIRSRARFAFSAADAGVVGIDSTKAQRAEEKLLVPTSPTRLL